jgi:hypothetical protein
MGIGTAGASESAAARGISAESLGAAATGIGHAASVRPSARAPGAMVT